MAEFKVDQATLDSVKGKVVVLTGMLAKSLCKRTVHSYIGILKAVLKVLAEPPYHSYINPVPT
jgi:hypothetical protein